MRDGGDDRSGDAESLCGSGPAAGLLRDCVLRRAAWRRRVGLAASRLVGSNLRFSWGSRLAPLVGDAAEMVLLIRPRTEAVPYRGCPIIKWLALSSPLRWPHGWPTNPMHDPRANGTRPVVFAADLARAVAGLEGIAAGSGPLEPAHGVFGAMLREDWQPWA